MYIFSKKLLSNKGTYFNSRKLGHLPCYVLRTFMYLILFSQEDTLAIFSKDFVDKRQAFHTQDSRGVFLIGTTYFLYQENIQNNQSWTACINAFSLPRKSIKEPFFYCMHSNTFSYKTFIHVLQESEQDTYLILGSTCITNKLNHPYRKQLLYLCN